MCFTSFSYKISLIKCLIDRLFKICNSWNSFHTDLESIKSNLNKNVYLPFLIDKVIKKCPNCKFSSNQNQLKDTSDAHYCKLPYVGNLSHHIKNNLLKLHKVFCRENLHIKLVFTSFKIKNYFSNEDTIPDGLKSLLLCKFTFAGCSSSYIGKNCHHFKTRTEEHIKKDYKSYIFKHPHSTATCFDSYNSFSFKIIDKVNTQYDLKIKDALHSKRTTKSFSFYPFTIASILVVFCLCFLYVFCVSISSIIFIISDLNYRHLLLS